MVNCPACDADLDLDEEQVQEGGNVVCSDCGAHFEVVNSHPLELDQINLEDDDDEDEDLDDEEEEEDLDDEEEDEAAYDDDEEDGYDDGEEE